MAINDDLYAALSAYPQTTLPERLFAYLGAQGYTGAMNDRLSQGGGLANVIGTLLGNVFSPGLWDHAAAVASGGSQILGPNRYRIYSSAGAISQVQVPGVLTAGRAYQFQLTFETPVLGTQVQVGDAGGNTDDFVSSLAGTRTVAFVADGTVATIKRPYVVSAGVPTDVVVKNVAVTDITATALNITSQPQAQSIVDGNTATFSVTVSAPFTAIFYQWEISTNGGVSWASYTVGSGTATSTLTTAAMTTADTGETFRCRIRMGNTNNATGQRYSNAATLTVAAANANPVAPTLALGDLTVDTGLVLSSIDLLAGATDPDGDTLTVTSVTAVSGGTVSGTGPWTITPTAEGAGSATVVISDGRGGTVNRTVTWNGVAAPSVPTITSVTGEAVDGGAFTVAGSGLAFAATLASVSGREAAGGNVAAIRGLIEHGTGPTWEYAADGTAVLNATAAPREVYFDFPVPKRAVYIEYGLQTSNVLPTEPWDPANAYQIKLARAKGVLGNEHSVAPIVGAIWDAKNLQIQNFRPGVAANRPGYTTAALANWVTYSHFAKLGNVGANADVQADYHLPIDGTPATVAGVDIREGRSNDFLGGILPGFFFREGFTATLNMRNFLCLDGSSRLVVGNNVNYAICTRRTTQPLSSHSASAAGGTWDLRAFEPSDDLYLFLLDDNNVATLVEQIRDAGTVDTYDWTTDMLGIRRVTNNGSSLVQLSGGSPDLTGTTYVDYKLAFKLSSYEPFTSGSVVTSFICCGAASVYRSTLSLNPSTGAVVINGEGNKNHTLGAFAPAIGQDCRWRLRLPTSGVGVPELWDEVSGVRLDNGASLPAGFGVWSPNRYFKGSTVGIAGDMYHIEATSDLGTIYELRLTEQVGTDIYSHHNNAVMATIVRASASLIDWWQP